MVRVNFDRLLRHQPERRRRRHERADRGAPLHARGRGRRRPITPRCSARTCSTKRAFAYLNGDPVTLWEAQELVDDLHARRLGAVHDRRVARRPTSSAIRCSSPTRCRGRAAGTTCGSAAASSITRPAAPAASRHGDARHVHVPQHDDGAVRSADAGRRAAVHAAGQLRHHQLRAEAVDVGRRSCRTASACSDDLTLDAGLRYDRQTLTDATNELRAAPRLRLASRAATRAWRFAAATAMYYTQIRANALGERADGRPRRPRRPTRRRPGQTGFPTCLTGPCLPLPFDPRTLPLSQQPARNITIRAGDARLLRSAVRELRAELRSAAELSRRVREPAQPGDRRSAPSARSCSGLFAGADYVHQHWTDLDRTRRPERADAVRSHGAGPDADASRRPTRRGRSCRSTAACAASTC